MRPVLEFWYEFASTYSYLAAMRIEAQARAAGVDVRWRPFLLGPIFAAQGWNTSPFNLYPAKGRHMWRDMEREAEAVGLPLVRPSLFPQNSIMAARLAVLGQDEPWGPDFTKALFRAEFAEQLSIAEPDVIRAALLASGCEPEPLIAASLSDETKAKLRAQNEAAVAHGIFGAPSFVTADGELFWGNDRMDRAIAWACERNGRVAGRSP